MSVLLGPTGAFMATDAAASGPTRLQWLLCGLVGTALSLGLIWTPHAAFVGLHALGLIGFSGAVLFRGLAIGAAKAPTPIRRLRDTDLPAYTVIVPLYREAEMIPSLLRALDALDYPRDRLQIIVVLEADDAETAAAMERHSGVEVLTAPRGYPRTKPRACNIALQRARGRYVVVYDAEDRPHPLQLREAAARFAQASQKTACLQAPLRIANGSGFWGRQFALEYAAQFEILLPALARIGGPFPLGGTSNHFRADVLRSVGGWDAWNVTEDADLGFRLAAHGWRSAMLRTPTWESAPTTYRDWRPQRARWVKGYMQTWGVQMRAPFSGGLGRLFALQATTGLAIVSALVHAPLMAWVIGHGLWAILFGQPLASAPDLALLVSGWGIAILAMSSGAKRIGLQMRLIDGGAAPLYWAMQSAAAAQAVWQLLTRPHHWDKTRHQPPEDRGLSGAFSASNDRPSDNGELDAEGAASVRRVA
jgi:cellulose synthase/poly-beta-1,6-N-acetylglucosamine synthase-like glycosyltransferase